MMNRYVLLLLAIFVAVVVVIMKLVSFFKAFSKETQYICYEMEHSLDNENYCKSLNRLHCHYLTLIPFVNEKNAMRVYEFIFRKKRQVEKKEEHKDSLVHLLLPSFFGICVCLLCVCSATWAWFSASVETTTQKITAAYYEVKVEAITDQGNYTIALEDGGYVLDNTMTYTITLKASGSVKNCGGYCKIAGTDTRYYTQTILPNESLTITFKPETSDKYTFTGVWGSIPSGIAEDEIIKGTITN